MAAFFYVLLSVKKDIGPLKSAPQLVSYYETLLVLFSVCLMEVCGGLITLNGSTQGANTATLLQKALISLQANSHFLFSLFFSLSGHLPNQHYLFSSFHLFIITYAHPCSNGISFINNPVLPVFACLSKLSLYMHTPHTAIRRVSSFLCWDMLYFISSFLLCMRFYEHILIERLH